MSDRRARFVRRAVVVCACSWIAFFAASRLSAFYGFTPGTFGLLTDARLTVVSVGTFAAARSAAADAGIRVGDRIGRPLTLETWMLLTQKISPAPQETIRLRVLRGTSSRQVTLAAQPVSSAFTGELVYHLTTAVGILLVAIGSALLLLFPTRMTWAFLAFAVGLNPAIFPYVYWVPAWFAFLNGLIGDVLNPLGYAGFITFAARFPNDRVDRLTSYAARTAPWVFAALAAIEFAGDTPGLMTQGVAEVVARSGEVVATAASLIGVGALVSTLLRTREAMHWASLWVACAFGIGLGLRRVETVLRLVRPDLPLLQADWSEAFALAQAAIPVAVTVAVVRYNAMRPRFFASRVLLYALFVCIVVLIFVPLDWLAGILAAHVPYTSAAFLAVALTLGAAIASSRGALARIVDRIVFPAREATSQAIERLRAQFAAPGSDRSFDRLAALTVHSLELGSTAVFAKTDDGGYVRVAACGWPDETVWHLLPSDRLISTLDADDSVVALTENSLRSLPFPGGVARPRFALLLRDRATTHVVAFVGDYLNGSHVDRDDARLLHGIFGSAASLRAPTGRRESGPPDAQAKSRTMREPVLPT